jgi:hypothetical protein
MSLSNFQRTAGLPAAACENPPIPFVPKVKNNEKETGASEKTGTINLEFFRDPNNPATKYQHHSLVSKDGHAEDWVK